MTALVLPPGLRPATIALLEEIARERLRQDKKWGGPAHDDGHSNVDWLSILAPRVEQLQDGAIDDITRKMLIEAAAVCLACVESYDRGRA